MDRVETEEVLTAPLPVEVVEVPETEPRPEEVEIAPGDLPKTLPAATAVTRTMTMIAAAAAM